jgi:arylsulfatase A-like enzyme
MNARPSAPRRRLLGAPCWLLAVAGTVLASAGCGPTRPPDVLLVVIDTLRADHLGAYGYTRARTPTIDALARQATVFENAMAHAPHTIPSMLQLMTSRYDQSVEIAPRERSLAQVLQARGYDTLAVVENPNFEQHPTAHGLMRGFRRFYRNGVLDGNSLAQQLYKTDTSADAVTTQALRAVRTRDRSRPLFLWVHYFDPHDPYLPPYADDLEGLSRGSSSAYNGDLRATDLYQQARPAPLAAADREHILALYDAEIRHVDQALGDLLEGLRRERLLEQAVFVLASDHGESFGEHDVWTHGRSAWDGEIHVPLIVRRPGQRDGRRVREAVGLVDVMPTILDLARVPRADLQLDGSNALLTPRGPAFLFWKEWQVVRTAEWKLLQYGPDVHLFDMTTDPDERRDVAAQQPQVVARLLSARDAQLARLKAAPGHLAQRSREAWERLRALGYLGP